MRDHIPFTKNISAENNAVVHWDSIGKIDILSVQGIQKEWMLIALSGSLYPEHTLLNLYIDLISPSLVSYMLDWSIGARRLINKWEGRTHTI